MLLLSLNSFAQLALEGFEGTWTPLSGTQGNAGPAGWYIRNVTGPIQAWNVTTANVSFGTRAAAIIRENAGAATPAEDWLITPSFNVPVNGQLKFYTRPSDAVEQNTTYKVMIGTNPADATTFTELQAWTDGTINTDLTVYEQKVVNIPAANNNQQRYIAFVRIGNNGDTWLVDEVQVVGQCFTPTALTSNASGTSATLGWTSANTDFEVEILTGNTPIGPATAVTGTTYTTPATLTPSTPYQFRVRAVCGPGNYSAWTDLASFTTSQIPATMNLTDGFEDGLKWTFVNGTQVNKWALGTGTANGGTHSLYVSNDGGVTNAYTNSSASVVQAYRDIQMPESVDQLLLSFDWKALGEVCCDYLRVYFVPATVTPVAGTQLPTAPAEGINITTTAGGTNFNNQANWSVTPETRTINAAAYAGRVMRLIFEWRNDGDTGNPPPAAIDNVNLSVITCPAPTNLALANINQNSASFTWTAPSSVTPTYDFYFSPVNTAPTASTSPTANIPTASLNLPGLQTSTTYYIWVRANCGTGDTSTWVGPLAFTTTQIPGTLTYAQDFEGTHGFGYVNGTSVNKWVVGTAAFNGGTKALYISNDNGVSNAYSNVTTTNYVHAYRDIAIPAGTAEVNVTFDWRSVGNTGDYLQVWAVPSTFNPTTGTQITTQNSGGVQIGGNFISQNTWTTYANTTNVAAYAGRMFRIIFQWTTNTFTLNQSPAAIDNLNISVVTCPKPTALVAAPGSTSATLTWTPQGTETSWEVYVVPTGTAAPTASTIGTVVTTPSYTATPLNGNAAYQYYVRAICGTSDKSIWAGPLSFSTTIANDSCDGAMPLPVNTTDACTQTTPVIFTSSTASTVPNSSCMTVANSTDIWYSFVATDFSNVISLSGFTLNATNGTAQNVIISVYENNCGAIGSAIGCSNTNYLRARNLTVGQTYLVRLSLNSASPALNTAFNICINTPVTPNNSNASDCLVSTIDSSFDNRPVTSGEGNVNVGQNATQGWKTFNTNGFIELWPSPASLANGLSAIKRSAYEGEFFVELNADGVFQTIYQDFDTPVSTTFTVSFAHKGRYGSDEIHLLAGNANSTDLTTYTMISNVTTPNDVQNATNGWVLYGQAPNATITYTVPAGQTKTRFVFQSGPTTPPPSDPSDRSSGNLLDSVIIKSDNSIITSSPAAADCVNNVVPVSAKGVGHWVAHTTNPGATTIASVTGNNTTITGFTVPGNYEYDWVTDFCLSTLVINYDAPIIAAPTGTAAYDYCVGATATTLTATGTAGYTLHWYDVATGGTELTAAPTPSTATAGVTTYYVSQSTGQCQGPRLAITVTVNAVPNAPVVVPTVTYCQNATATALTATADTGNTLTWYDVATGGIALAAAPTPSTATTGVTTYYVSQTGTGNCESPRAAITVTVSVPGPQQAAFTLPASVCIAAATNPVAVLATGTVTGGTFTSSDATNLVVNATTGEINLAASTAGTYTVTYTVAGSVTNCSSQGTDTQTIVLTPLATPVTGFTYGTVCVGSANQTPTLATGFPATGASFTSSDATNLVVNATTGEIDMALSQAGTYTVTVNFAQDAVNCIAAATNSTSVTITPLATPVTGFSYTNVCATAANQLPALTTGFNTGGTYASTTGLVFANAATGEINIAASTPGLYTITYTLLQDNANCLAGGTNTAQIEITPAATPVTGFTYTNVCVTAANQLPTLATGFRTGGVFSSTTGLSVNASTGEINIAGSTPGAYVITYTTTADNAACIAASVTTANITISPAVNPVVAFEFDASYCFGTGNVTPDLATGFVSGGTFTATGGITINPATGAFSLANAAPGTYSVTYTIPANPANCDAGGTNTETFTVGTEILFTIDGECNGAAYVLTATPDSGSFDPATVTYQWSTPSGTPIGTDSAQLNVSDYLSSTPAVETFPLDFVLTVNNNGCSTPVTYTVTDISCEIQRGISPGGSDGLNDYFDLAQLGVKKLTIFNRYGAEVYAKKNYTTEWVGQTNGGDELPTGTYFWVMERNVGETKTGWIYINRHE